MTDALSLRQLFQKTDGTAPAIQATAGAMMKHYDKSPQVAVTEWRNALMKATKADQQLALLYVANEVLQNSKRNRGIKFLEAFSPILGQALTHICQQNSPTTVEKVRRTVKIWGDRHVFSQRFVNDLLKGLDPYRGGNNTNTNNNNNNNNHTNKTTTNTTTTTMTTSTVISSSSSASTPSPSSMTTSPSGNPRFSPLAHLSSQSPEPVLASSSANSQSKNGETNKSSSNEGISNSDLDDNDNDDDDDDNDGDLFGDSTDGIKLDLAIDLDEAATVLAKSHKENIGDDDNMNSNNPNNNGQSNFALDAMKPTKPGMKRKRSKDGSAMSSSGASKRKSILSTSSLMELWNRVAASQQEYDHVQASLQDITEEYLEEPASQLESLVGDELLEQYRQVQAYETLVIQQRVELHSIAQKRRALELEAVRYLPWLEATLHQDLDDIEFCKTLLQKLQCFSHIHGPARAARDERLALEAKQRQEQEELEKRRREEEERKKFMESAMKKETEAKPGMVWNRATGEYQYLKTDESWRD